MPKKYHNKISAATISGILKEKHHIYISKKHIYWLIKNDYLDGITTRIFPYLKYRRYYKKKLKKQKDELRFLFENDHLEFEKELVMVILKLIQLKVKKEINNF